VKGKPNPSFISLRDLETYWERGGDLLDLETTKKRKDLSHEKIGFLERKKKRGGGLICAKPGAKTSFPSSGNEDGMKKKGGGERRTR